MAALTHETAVGESRGAEPRPRWPGMEGAVAVDALSGVDRVEAARVVVLLVATVAFIASLPAAASLPMAVRVSEVTMIVAAVVVCGTTRRHAVVALVLAGQKGYSLAAFDYRRGM